MSEREKISVDIYGQLYNLRVTPEEKERVLAIARHVDNMMKKVADSQGRLDYRDVAVLAAMNLTEEYFKLQQAYEEILAIVNEER
ncbi:MAG: cell division protein ZapA [Peptococcaceae bacterium]|nr:cell division protein ZapA [Peptococcaceae bacterium]MBQ2013629.1 cell division protein ZapA [Peptococcaceae bacterium]MBQ2035325.1 cell division protein ZapA [Peptococcaceae bacterium]MBQ5652270.1 cell division protein ZapA [Peptococcaceae bacterium]MBQ5703346.1 cell division protein ZapA [Peptococcaceae bacterium]